MKKLILISVLIWLNVAATAAGFTDSVNVGLPTTAGTISFTLKLSQPGPPQVGVYQAVMLFGCPSEKLNQLHNDLKSNLANSFSSSNRVAMVLVKTQLDTNFARLSQTLLADSIQAGLNKLAAKANRPELINAPVLAIGFAKASRFALSVASAMPGKTAGFVSARAYRLSGITGGSISGIPHLVLTGEVSGPDVRNNAGVYFSSQMRNDVLVRRNSGELVAQAVEMNASQSTLKAKTWNYLFSFLQKVVEKRIPANSNPVAGPVALSSISAASGYLGKSTAWDSFSGSNYSVSAFSGPLVPGQSFWFLDQAQADAWRSFHISAFDSALVSPLPLAAIPWCTGQRPSSINAKIRMNPSIVLDPNNFYRLEVSDVTGNFDHPVYQARYFGTTSSASIADSISDGLFPDNFNFMTNVSDPNTKRYRVRIISTNPYFESPNTGEISLINFCGPGGGQPRLYLSTVKPFKSTYSPGDSVAVMLYKNPLAAWTAGDVVRMEISDKNGSFATGLGTALANFTPPFSSASTPDSLLIRLKIPDTLSFGNKYRLKAFISNIPINQGRQTATNGHDITLAPNQSGNQIVINTKPVSDTTQTTAVSGGNILFDGGSPITSKGICWSTFPSPTTALSTKTNDGTSSAAYFSNLSGLSPGTLYYLRAYAINANQTQYGNELTFRTKQANQVPVLITTPVSQIGQTSATAGGNISFDGNSPIKGRGVCWSTNPNPALWNAGTDSTGDGLGTGLFTSNLSGLSANTTYYLRAYARNNLGIGYGNEVNFTTASTPVTVATVLTQTVQYVAGNDSATGRGNVTFDGGAAVSAKGVVWGTNPLPEIGTANNAAAGSGTGQFNIKFGPLSPATTYFVRAYAVNSAGVAYGDETSFITTVSVSGKGHRGLIQAFPNPANEKLYIKSDELPDEKLLRVESADGKHLNISCKKSDYETLELDTRSLPPGIYIIRFYKDGIPNSLKFFK
jgi:hypothetical protein